MTSLRLLASALLLPAIVSVSACAADEGDPELGIAAVDRGTVVMYGPGPSGGEDHWLDDDMGVLIVANSYDEAANHGHAQFRIYTMDSGVWTEVHLQTLCTDGNWVEARSEDFVSPHYWMFVDLDCPAPYSVSETWASIGLDY